MLYYAIGYIVVGYISALLYYKTFNEIDGKKIEYKGQKAFMLFLIWPIIIVVAIALIPFMEKKVSR